MKRSVGKALQTISLLLILFFVTCANATLTTEVDRRTISMGETLRLTINGNGNDHPDEVDLSVLNRHWQIVSKSTSTSTSFINGNRAISSSVELDLIPLRDGILSIPALSAGGVKTTPLAITVNPMAPTAPTSEGVKFEARIDKFDAYVQEQVMLTITVEQAINLDGGEVSQPKVANAVVEPLQRLSFQRQDQGRVWRVTQLRYAIFPQQRGDLLIPQLDFVAREILPGRSLLGARLGKRIRLKSDAINIKIKPVPPEFPGSTWLPARQVELKESWSVEPNMLAVGDSTTRTLKMTADGLLSSQLPSISSFSEKVQNTGLRIYPDQESNEQVENNETFVATRTRSEAIVASNVGDWSLPEISVPWWNIETDALEYARLPNTTVNVTAIERTGAKDSEILPVSKKPVTSKTLWAVAISGWLATMFLSIIMLRQKMGFRASGPTEKPPAQSSSSRLALLKAACAKNDAASARSALLSWASTQFDRPVTSLDALVMLTSDELATEIKSLERTLYGKEKIKWQGGGQLFNSVRKQNLRMKPDKVKYDELYPIGH